ncbi:Flp pilus assembly protein CpaB [Lacipirellula limnantheis]|uniref:SAF domain protein n=1 Tax=Lacipirellula limnantheis TaxID=2528024 RepID=A0A517TXF6_9BACT|nr:Flp pilus assembly protein CpaB [Lacipirellula limnantheis]QDT73047.1 SAF domain protein [Lacipirellula limnantheis]
MRPKSLILLALALGCGLVASIGISQVLDGNNRPAAVATAPIYVALQNVNVGDPLTEKMVALEEWPKDKVPVGAISKWEDLEDRRPRSNIYQGEPLLENKLLAKGERSDPIQGVPAGMRLKTISVDARKSAAGLLSPGDRVDVQIYVRANPEHGIKSPFTKIFLQNIRVYAVDQAIDKAADGEEARNVAKTVSLIVTPAQANRINLAENMGEISLIPRNPDDDAVVEDSEQGTDELFGRSTSNDRESEQYSQTEESSEGALSGFKSLMQQALTSAAAAAAANPQEKKPHFQMKIIYPNEISTVQFSEDGEPIGETNGPRSNLPFPAPGSFTSPTLPVAPTPAPGPAPAPPDGTPTPADFPIDLRLK